VSTATKDRQAPKELGLNGIFDLALGYQRAQALFAANGLGVFRALAKGGRTAADLAGDLGLESEALAPLLDVCVSVGILKRSGETYSNTRTAGLFLVPGREASFHNVLAFWQKFTYATWGRLEESIREYAARGEGARGPDLFDRLLANPDEFRTFFDGLVGLAFWPARKISESYDFGRRKHLLDIGGGAGAFSEAIARRHAGLEVTLFDLEAVCALANERFETAGIADRARAVAGDFFNDPFPAGIDCALVANVLHDWSPDECRRLVARIHDALPPGGEVIIYEVMKPEDASSPPEVDSFALALHMDTQRGHLCRIEDMRGWLTDAGFENVRREPVTGGTSMVIASR